MDRLKWFIIGLLFSIGMANAQTTLPLVNNGDSGLIARNKINAALALLSTPAAVIDVATASAPRS